MLTEACFCSYRNNLARRTYFIHRSIQLQLLMCTIYYHSSFTSFLAHLAKGQVSFCHHLASVVCRILFQKSFPLKLLDQLKPNLV